MEYRKFVYWLDSLLTGPRSRFNKNIETELKRERMTSGKASGYDLNEYCRKLTLTNLRELEACSHYMLLPFFLCSPEQKQRQQLNITPRKFKNSKLAIGVNLYEYSNVHTQVL